MFNDIKRNTYGESSFRVFTDIEARRYRDQTGLDTPVVYTVNNEYLIKLILSKLTQ